MKKQNNAYTVGYVALLVLIVGLGLSLVYQALRPLQEANMADDKKKQILAAALITPADGESVAELYKTHITETFNTDYTGRRIEGGTDPFDVDVEAEVKKPERERILPVFVCRADGADRYIVPVYGAGLWGPIWGYVAVDPDGDTVYGAYFAHQGETPGLGAEIEKPAFTSEFRGKKLYTDGIFTSVAVVKSGHAPQTGAYADAVSGATITSHGVSEMLRNSLSAYNNFFKQLQSGSRADK